MAQQRNSIDRVWGEFRSFPPAVQGEFIKRLVADATLRANLRDTLDGALVKERANEPDRPWDEMEDEITEMMDEISGR